MSDNATRLARETKIVRSYGAYVTFYAFTSALTILLLVLLQPASLSLVTALSFFVCILFAAAYQYFGLRFLVNLGTRYDLFPIVRRSLLLQDLSNRPIIYYVCSMVSFLVGWASLLWGAL